MIVYTTGGSIVSLEDTNKKSLFDRDGVEWARYPEGDTQDPFGCAYRETKNNISVIKLTRDELKRTIAGVQAMQTPTTVMEMRYYALHLPKQLQWEIDCWQDQQLREIIADAEEHHSHPGHIMENRAWTTVEAREQEKARAEEETRRETPREATEGTPVARKTRGTAKRTSRKRTQEDGLSVTLGETSIALTSKQLEFMERLSECPGWGENEVAGGYIASQYAEELSDTMNPMSVGAVLTTLREKGLLTTEKTRMGGVKCCVFTLTKLGTAVYNKLAGKEDTE